MEPVENAIEVLGRDAGPAVVDLDPTLPQAHFDRGVAAVVELGRIVEQVRHRSLQGGRSTKDGAGVRVDQDVAPCPASGPGGHALEQRGQIDWSRQFVGTPISG